MPSSDVYNGGMEFELPPTFDVEGDDKTTLTFYLDSEGDVTATSKEGPYEVTDFWITSRVVSTRRGRPCVRIKWFTPDLIALETGEVIERETPCNGWAFLDADEISPGAPATWWDKNGTFVLACLIVFFLFVLPFAALIIAALIMLSHNPGMV